MPVTSPTSAETGETVIVEETHNGPFQLKVRAGTSTFIVDQPIGVGGLGSGPNPYDLLSAALGACSLMTMRMYATRKGWPAENIRVRVTHHRRGLEDADTFVREIQFTGNLGAEQQQRLVEIAAHCPVHKTLERSATVQTTLVSSGDLEDEALSLCEHMRDMGQACDQQSAVAGN